MQSDWWGRGGGWSGQPQREGCPGEADRQGCWEAECGRGALSAPSLREARPVVVGLTADPPAPSAALGSQPVPSTHRSDGPMAACVSGAQQSPRTWSRPPAQRGQRPPGPGCVGTGGPRGSPGDWMTARLPRLPSSQGDWQETRDFPGAADTPLRKQPDPSPHCAHPPGLSCVPCPRLPWVSSAAGKVLAWRPPRTMPLAPPWQGPLLSWCHRPRGVELGVLPAQVPMVTLLSLGSTDWAGMVVAWGVPRSCAQGLAGPGAQGWR